MARSGSPTPQEIQRRQSHTAKVIQVFRDCPRHWIIWTRFRDLVGERAYRTRISNAKEVFEAEGGTVESRTYPCGAEIVTEYRYLDHQPLGRSADVPSPDAWPAFDAPIQEPWRLT